MVHRFERQLEELASTDAVGPEQMGRTAAKMESLDMLGLHVGDTAKHVGFSLRSRCF